MNNIIDCFKKTLNECSKKYSYQELILKFGEEGASRLEIMLVDSALKRMPIHSLKDTLLLLPSKFNEVLRSATYKLSILNDNK